jgi:ABC-2 type transport system permease protein
VNASSSTTASYHAPSAFGGDLRRFWGLTFVLASTEFKLRFFGSVLGYLWTLMRPLLLFGVLYLVFTQALKVGAKVPHYPVYLLTAIVLFTYFAEATGGAVQSLVVRENLLRKIRFPRMVIPLSVSLTALFNLAANLVAVLIFALASGVYPRTSWLELPLLILVLVVLSTGVGMLLAAAYVRYRDVQPIWEVTQQLLFYASGILFIVTDISGRLFGSYPARVLLCNPLAAIFAQARRAFIGPERAPSVATALGGAPRLAIPLGIVAAVFGVGLWFFNREAPRIAENL